jgi:hypothetical protein
MYAMLELLMFYSHPCRIALRIMNMAMSEFKLLEKVRGTLFVMEPLQYTSAMGNAILSHGSTAVKQTSPGGWPSLGSLTSSSKEEAATATLRSDYHPSFLNHMQQIEGILQGQAPDKSFVEIQSKLASVPDTGSITVRSSLGEITQKVEALLQGQASDNVAANIHSILASAPDPISGEPYPGEMVLAYESYVRFSNIDMLNEWLWFPAALAQTDIAESISSSSSMRQSLRGIGAVEEDELRYVNGWSSLAGCQGSC